MWRTLITVLAILTAAMVFYLTLWVHRFSLFRKIGEKHRAVSWLISFLTISLCGLFSLINVMTMEIVILHLALFLSAGDLVMLILWKFSKKKPDRDVGQGVALVLAVLYLGIGCYNACHVTATRYSIQTDKDLQGQVRIVGIADAHLGVTLNGEKFAEVMERVQGEAPDIVVILGDFVDDDSTKENMLAACSALGRLRTTYGVYYIFGNHDNGYYRYRNFSAAELREALSENHVTILEDEAVLLDGRISIVGRRDRSFRGRASAEQLTDALDHNIYTVILDHQPNDYDQEAASGADLVLSGHTHGGHIFPAGQIGLMMGSNDSRYGVQIRGDTTFIVTSGISGWAIPIKTGTFSEYIVVDISGG